MARERKQMRVYFTVWQCPDYLKGRFRLWALAPFGADPMAQIFAMVNSIDRTIRDWNGSKPIARYLAHEELACWFGGDFGDFAVRCSLDSRVVV